MGSSRWLLKLHLHLSISTALMRPRRPKQYCLQLDIALWCKNQIEHSIWDESLLFCNCACSLEYSSLSTLAGLSYHIGGKLEVAFKASPSSQHQHCTDICICICICIYIYIYIYIYRKVRLMKATHDSLLLRGSCLRIHPVREIAKTVYIKSCDVIGRAKTTTNHIVRAGLKTSELFAWKPYCNAAFRQ